MIHLVPNERPSFSTHRKFVVAPSFDIVAKSDSTRLLGYF